MRIVAAVIAFSLAAPAFAGSEIYKYTDAKGVIRFATNLAEVPPARRAAAQASAAARVKPEQPTAAAPAAASELNPALPPGSQRFRSGAGAVGSLGA